MDELTYLIAAKLKADMSRSNENAGKGRPTRSLRQRLREMFFAKPSSPRPETVSMSQWRLVQIR